MFIQTELTPNPKTVKFIPGKEVSHIKSINFSSIDDATSSPLAKRLFLIDGVDIRQIDPADLRRNVGFMLQETWLFSGSIKENIQMGYSEYSDEQILNVCAMSGVDEFVRHNPQGYDYQLKERGEGISGGQRQSINLARALLHNPSTLILDEPTSSMDSATEKVVLDNLAEWLKDKTLLAITHRNTLVRLATRVLVIDRGMLVADELPEKLLGQ